MARPITKANIFATQTGNVPASQIDTDFDTLYSAVNDSSNGWSNYVVDTGTANNYIVTLTSVPISYNTGMTIFFTPTNTNGGASVINVNALGNKPIVNKANIALTGFEIIANKVCGLVYDGTSFRIITKNALTQFTSSAAGTFNIECAGYDVVQAQFQWTNVASAVNITVNLNHIAHGTVACISFLNPSASVNNLSLNASDENGTVYSVVAVCPGTFTSSQFSGGAAINVQGVNTNIAANTSVTFTGVAGPELLFSL